MKILMVNKFFYIKGGSETYYFSLKKLLEDNGHEVIDFSMNDEKNFDSKYSKYFVNNIDYNKSQSFFSKIKIGMKIIYSFEAKRKLEKLIQETHPDIAHLHIFQHQLTSSVIDVLKKYNIPIVYTAHDLKMVCPNYKMLDNNCKVCEKCKGDKYINCLKNKCIKKSAIKSCIGMIEAYFNKIRNSYDKIDLIITPSKFYKEKFIEFGVDKNKIEVVPNFLDKKNIELENTNNNKEYFLYFGRLSEEKGIKTLILAARRTNINLKIVGTGPIEDDIKKEITTNKDINIELMGFKHGKELNTIIYNAKAVIIPSEWYENGPYSAIETLKLGVPLIGTNIGGIPELISNNENGFVYESKNIDELVDKINRFENMTENELIEFKNSSYKMFINKYTDENHYKKIYNIYKKMIDKDVKK